MKVVVFDFDGVILPSETIKQQGYSWIFSEFGEEVPYEAIAAAHEEFSNARGNRYDVIRSILKRIGKSDDLEHAVEKYVERFQEVVSKRLNEFKVEPGILAMLERLSETQALYINSNTPDEPLNQIVERLGIRRYFKGVYGSDRSKVENLRRIGEREDVAMSEMCFIGDGEGDRRAAREIGCEFYGVATESNGWKDSTEINVIKSLSEFGRRDRGFERMV